MMHGYIPPHRFFPYLTWQEIAAMPNLENVVILQPVGAIEQHGPHLPLIVDSALGMGVLGRALSQLEAEIPAYCLPPLYYGKSNEHWYFPGTITLSAKTLLSVLMEVGESIYRAGFRKLAFVNSHGGQPEVVKIAAVDLHQCYPDFSIFPLFLWRVPNAAAELFTAQELELGIHAGDLETSAMLSLMPEQVRMEKAVEEFPHGLPKDSLLSMEGQLPFAWQTRDLTRSGVLGNASIATQKKGDRLLESVVQGWVKLIEDIHFFQQPQA